ncbi:MAG: hypothetical protein AAFQ43_09665 [Bacteroidota bacterium]
MPKTLAAALIALVPFVALAQPGPSPAPSTAVYAEALGATDRYSIGAEHAVTRVNDAAISLRIGVSYTDEGSAETSQRRVFAVPAGVLLRVPLLSGRWPVYLEAEGGLMFARWDGPFNEIDPSPGESFRLFPHASGFVRTRVAGPVFVRGGVTAGGLRSRGEWSPTVGVGVGL